MTIKSQFRNLRKQVDSFEEEFAEEFLQRLKDRTPVQTGQLQAAWEKSVTPGAITISNSMPYAAYVEYGTPVMAPRAMLRTTVAEAESIAADVVARVTR